MNETSNPFRRWWLQPQEQKPNKNKLRNAFWQCDWGYLLDWNRLELILPQAPRPPQPLPPHTPLHSSQPPYALAVLTRAPRSEGEHGSLLIFCGRRDDKFWSHISLFILKSLRAAGGLREEGGGRTASRLPGQSLNQTTFQTFPYIWRWSDCGVLILLGLFTAGGSTED